MRIHRAGAAAALALAVATLLACESDGGVGGAGGADSARGGGGGAADFAVGGADGAGGPDAVRRAPERIPVEEARAWLLSDAHDTLLVCAYGEPSLCEGKMLEGAITLADLEAQEAAGELALDREIIFYCS